MSTRVISIAKGLTATTVTTGASLVSLKLPNGVDVVLGFRDLEDYRSNPPYIGCSVGRCTNRTGGARFLVDGKEYHVTPNVPPNHLHGGHVGFNKAEWVETAHSPSSVTYSLTSPDMDQGYPGMVIVTITYSLTSMNELLLEYEATTDAPTPINLTNHTYFNLAGQGDILGHLLTLHADQYTPVGEGLVPTGELASIEGTPLDFRSAHLIGAQSQDVPGGVGYDNNYVLSGHPCHPDDNSLHKAAKMQDPSTGTSLEVFTNQPCVQLYMGGYLDGSFTGKDGQPIKKFSGVCLETQKHPDAVNKPNFPTTVLRAGERYFSKTVWKFTWE